VFKKKEVEVDPENRRTWNKKHKTGEWKALEDWREI
jgi:hypothetical protein